MINLTSIFRVRILQASILSGIFLIPATLPAADDQGIMDAKTITERLKKPLTRGFKPVKANKQKNQEDAISTSIGSRPDNTIQTQQDVQATAASANNSANAGRVNLRIEFEYNSAQLTFEAEQQLLELALAINSSELRSSSFEVIGHTDATGSQSYNQDLSVRRAYSVERFLTERQGINDARLSVTGMGELAPLNRANPYSAVNRRVEIVNTSE